jgi:hypothetical protein
VVLAETAWAGNPVSDGHERAVEACSACHQVDATQKRPPPVAEGQEGARTEAPSFMEIADRCLGPDELRKRIANPHYPMREQEFLPVDLSDIALYIQSLSHKPQCVTRASSR